MDEVMPKFEGKESDNLKMPPPPNLNQKHRSHFNQESRVLLRKII